MSFKLLLQWRCISYTSIDCSYCVFNVCSILGYLINLKSLGIWETRKTFTFLENNNLKHVRHHSDIDAGSSDKDLEQLLWKFPADTGNITARTTGPSRKLSRNKVEIYNGQVNNKRKRIDCADSVAQRTWSRRTLVSLKTDGEKLSTVNAGWGKLRGLPELQEVWWERRQWDWECSLVKKKSIHSIRKLRKCQTGQNKRHLYLKKSHNNIDENREKKLEEAR